MNICKKCGAHLPEGAQVCTVCGTHYKAKLSKKTIFIIVVATIVILVASVGLWYSLSYKKQVERFMDAMIALDMEGVMSFYPPDMLENTAEDRQMFMDRFSRYQERYGDSLEITYTLGEFELIETGDAEHELSLFYGYEGNVMSAYLVTNTIHLNGEDFSEPIDAPVDLLVFFKDFKWYVVID